MLGIQFSVLGLRYANESGTLQIAMDAERPFTINLTDMAACHALILRSPGTENAVHNVTLTLLASATGQAGLPQTEPALHITSIE